MSGEVCHFEIPADDLARARKFYASTFGWNLAEMPGTEYTLVRTGAVNDEGMPTEPGYIGGGIAKRQSAHDHPRVVILVDDIATAAKSIEKHGGKMLGATEPIGDGSMGFSAHFRDSEGNVVGLFQPTKT